MIKILVFWDVTKFTVVAPNICGSSVWTPLRITCLSQRILVWLLDF